MAVGAILSSSALASQKPSLSTLNLPVPDALEHSEFVGPAPDGQLLHLCLCLRMPHPDALQTFVDDVSDPASPHYGRFVGPTELGERFGQPAASVSAVVDYLKRNGFRVNLVGKDRLHILADGTVAQADAAFHTEIDRYHSLSPSENGRVDFISYTRPPSLPSDLAKVVEHIGGLQTWNRAVPASVLAPGQASVLYNTAPLVNAGRRVLGQGRTIGISSWDGFALSNTDLFIKHFELPVPPGGALSNISVRSIGGGSENGQRLAEGDLDPQMVIGQAPLAKIIIYDGAGGGDSATDQQVLAVYAEEEDENEADIITESYAWALTPADCIAAHNLHLLMNAEGITYMAASGDSQSAWEQVYWYSTCEPEVLIVGGTSATVDAKGQRQSEVPWQDGSGGWPTIQVPFNHRPAWQKGRGVPSIYNFRLNPDVAGHASGTFNSTQGAYYFYYNGGLNGDYIGTSFACPIFAGGLAIAEQEIIEERKVLPDKHGHYRLGRLQDLIYQQNGDPSVWHDIIGGNNGDLPNGLPSYATLGWDTCTGWGTVNWDGFVRAFPYPPR